MIVIPFQVGPSQYSVFVGIEEDGMARLREHDPAQFEPSKLGPRWQSLVLVEVLVGYVTPEDIARVHAAAAAGETIRSAILHLVRGWKFDPAQGDHDHMYVSLTRASN